MKPKKKKYAEWGEICAECQGQEWDLILKISGKFLLVPKLDKMTTDWNFGKTPKKKKYNDPVVNLPRQCLNYSKTMLYLYQCKTCKRILLSELNFNRADGRI